MTAARRSPGFTMMSMLFILVALAALGAALAGLDWGSYQVLRAGGQPACFGTKSLALPEELAGYTVTISCLRTPAGTVTVNDGDTTLAFYDIVATACNIPSAGACPNTATTEPTYVERQLSRSVQATP